MRLILGFVFWYSITLCSGQISFKEIKEESDFCNETKITYVHVYTEWCGLCKNMKQSVYLKRSVKDYLSDNFYTTQWNPEVYLESKVKAWKIKQYPTLLFLDSLGNIIYRYSGVLESGEFLKVLKTVKFISTHEISEVETIKSFNNIDAYGRSIIKNHEINEILSKELIDHNDLSMISKGMISTDPDTFIAITKRLENTPLNFKEKIEIKASIVKYYSFFIQQKPSTKEIEHLTAYIENLSGKIKPEGF